MSLIQNLSKKYHEWRLEITRDDTHNLVIARNKYDELVSEKSKSFRENRIEQSQGQVNNIDLLKNNFYEAINNKKEGLLKKEHKLVMHLNKYNEVCL